MAIENSITVTNGSVTVTGYLTAFVATEGDLLVANGLSAEILRQDNSAQITLKKPWPGPTETDVTNFRIMKTAPYWHSTLSVAEKVIELIQRLQAGMPFKVDAFGAFTGRAQYNDQARGFTYLATDLDPMELYIKQSSTAGDWTAGINLRGADGPPGPQGPAGSPPASLTIGNVQTLPAGQNATASVTGTPPNQILNLGIPQGSQGQPGTSGAPGGVMPTISYTSSRQLILSDGNKRIRVDSDTPVTLTIPTNASVAYALDTEIHFFCAGQGDLTVAAASGVSIIPSAGLTLTEPGSWLVLRKVGTNTWDSWGDRASGGGTTNPTTQLVALSLSAANVAENVPGGTLVGAVIGKTPNSTLSLVNDAGGRFILSGTNILTGTTSLDYETATSHNITIRETLNTAGNSPKDTTIVITITDVQEGTGPQLTALTLSSTSIMEDAPIGATVGSIGGKTIGSTLSLLNNAGGRFAISGTNLVTAAALDYETNPTHAIVIRETLTGAANTPRDTTFTISVGDVVEGGGTPLAPLSVTSASVNEGASAGTVVATLTGMTSGSSLSLTNNGGGRFQLVGDTIRTTGNPTIDYEAASSHLVTVTETIGGAPNSPRDTSIRIAVAKVSPTPVLSPLRLSPNTVPEGSPAGTIVGTILDVAAGSTLSITGTAGSRFTLAGNVVKTGSVTTDYETGQSHTISITETLAGAAGSPRVTSIVVGVTDVIEGGVGTDQSPNNFTIPTITGADLNSPTTSPPIKISGITAATPISVVGLTYSKNNGAFTSAAGTVLNDDILVFRQTSSASYNTATSGAVTVGDKTATFTVYTRTSTGLPAAGTILIEEGVWAAAMSYDAAGGSTGPAAMIWPPELLTMDNANFDRQANGSIIFNAPVDGARLGASAYARVELREIVPDGQVEYDWTPETGGREEFTAAVLELPTQTVGTAGSRVVLCRIRGADGDACRLYYYADGHLEMVDEKAGAGTSGSEQTFPLQNASNAVSAIPLGAYFTGVVEMDATGIRATINYNGVNYTAFSALSNFWPGKPVSFRLGAYNAIGKVGGTASQQGTGRSRVQYERILRPKHPHVIGSGTGTVVSLGGLALSAASIDENSPAGTLVGTILGRTVGSTLSLLNSASNRFAISGDNIVAGSVSTDYETATSHTIQIRETLAGAVNTPRDTSITIAVNNLPEGAVTLAPLTLTASTVEQGSPSGTLVGTIQGKTNGSTLSMTDSASGRFALSGMTIVAGSTPANLTPGNYTVTIRETLTGATNTPRDTTFTLVVTELMPALPAGFGFVLDGSGNYIVDQAGAYVIAEVPGAAPPTGATIKTTSTSNSGSNPVTSLAVPITQPVVGSLLLCCFTVAGNAGTFSIPSGWTQVAVQSTFSVSSILCWRRATGNESTVTGSWGTAGLASGMVLEVPDATGSMRVAFKRTTEAADDLGVNGVPIAPSGTAPTNEIVLAFGLVASFYSVSTPAWTNGFTAHNVTAGTGPGGGIFVGYKVVNTGGTTTTDFSFSGSATQVMGFMVSFSTTVSGGGGTEPPPGTSTPPFTAPSGFQWPTQVDPVNHNRNLETIWGKRPAGSNSQLQDYNEFRVTVTRKPYAFSSPDNNEIRIEVRSGDHYSEPDWTDPDTSERSEFQCTVLPPVSASNVMSWESRFEGSQNTASWCVIMQSFARGAGGSPPLALTFESNDTLKLITRTSVGGSPLENYRYQFTPSRNTWYKFSLEWKWSITNGGFVRFYINDSLAWQGTGLNVGYSGQTAWEPTLGIYRREAPETMVHRFRNFVCNW